MKDDLISREAALEELGECPENWTDSPEEIEAGNSWCFAADVINSAPTVPAVPLDKLCEWLERYAMMNCDGCREGFGSCEDEENQEVSVCNSRERWKAMLTKWMEEQDAKEET